MDGVTDPVLRHCIEHGIAIIRTDYYLARRQRLHLGWHPLTDERYESDRLVDVLQWAADAGVAHVVILPGARTKPARQYWMALMPLPPLRG